MRPSRLRAENSTIVSAAVARVPAGPAISGSILVQRLRWLLTFTALASLTFLNLSQTLAAAVFLLSAVALGAIDPKRALQASFSDWLPWMQIGLVLLSVTWSVVPDLSARYGVELVLTAVSALIIARSVTPRDFLSALLCAYFLSDMASVFVGRFTWNAGSLAMIGAFGSKNAFSAVQAIFLLTSCWVLLDVRQGILLRGMALFGMLVCPVLLVAGRSADAVAPVALATSFTLLLFGTGWLPRRQRILLLCAGGALIACLFTIAFIFSDTIMGQLLTVTGKDVTLSGRTYMWARASEFMQVNPILGTGFGGFWFQGNPYAEELWAHFGITGRGGFNFHNLWYEMGVELGYFGIASAAVTLLAISARAIRAAAHHPVPSAMFVLGYVMIIDMRSLLEVEILSQFSLAWVLLIVAGVYARQAATHSRAAATIKPRALKPGHAGDFRLDVQRI
jgi:exopolysaccharide production protein ExoQ